MEASRSLGMSLKMGRFVQSLGFGLGLALCLGSLAPALADIVHFANGNNLLGKLDRVTGDIIEFKHSLHFFGSMDYFKRIQLTDRHDVVETRHGKKYYGEIIYLDGLTLEIQTTSGTLRLNRMELAGVVMGSPSDKPTVPDMRPVQDPNFPTEAPPKDGIKTISDTRPAKPASSINKFDTPETEETIPAIERPIEHRDAQP
jgi:hypothetical protein